MPEKSASKNLMRKRNFALRAHIKNRNRNILRTNWPATRSDGNLLVKCTKCRPPAAAARTSKRWRKWSFLTILRRKFRKAQSKILSIKLSRATKTSKRIWTRIGKSARRNLRPTFINKRTLCRRAYNSSRRSTSSRWSIILRRNTRLSKTTNQFNKPLPTSASIKFRTKTFKASASPQWSSKSAWENTIRSCYLAIQVSWANPSTRRSRRARSIRSTPMATWKAPRRSSGTLKSTFLLICPRRCRVRYTMRWSR